MWSTSWLIRPLVADVLHSVSVQHRALLCCLVRPACVCCWLCLETASVVCACWTVNQTFACDCFDHFSLAQLRHTKVEVFLIIFFNAAKHINVGCLFRNIRPSLQYPSHSLIHTSLHDSFFHMFILHYTFSPLVTSIRNLCGLPQAAH